MVNQMEEELKLNDLTKEQLKQIAKYLQVKDSKNLIKQIKERITIPLTQDIKSPQYVIQHLCYFPELKEILLLKSLPTITKLIPKFQKGVLQDINQNQDKDAKKYLIQEIRDKLIEQLADEKAKSKPNMKAIKLIINLYHLSLKQFVSRLFYLKSKELEYLPKNIPINVVLLNYIEPEKYILKKPLYILQREEYYWENEELKKKEFSSGLINIFFFPFYLPNWLENEPKRLIILPKGYPIISFCKNAIKFQLDNYKTEKVGDVIRIIPTSIPS